VVLKIIRVHPAASTARRRVLVLGVVLSLASLMFVVSASSAFAWHASLSGDAVCEPDGTWTVNWSASNSQTDPGQYMLVRAASVSDGSLVGIEANGTYDGVVDATHPNATEGGGTVIAPDGSTVQFSTPNLPNSVTSVTVTVTGYWHFIDGDGHDFVTTEDASFTVDRPGCCVDTRPGHIEVAKSTTGDTAPPGPFTFLIQRDDVTVGSISVPANGTGTSGDLAPGTYTLVEVDAPPGATIAPNPVVVPANTTVTVTATNPYPDAPPTVLVAPPVVLIQAPPAPPPVPVAPVPVPATGRFTG
jgi:hypothetical protein